MSEWKGVRPRALLLRVLRARISHGNKKGVVGGARPVSEFVRFTSLDRGGRQARAKMPAHTLVFVEGNIGGGKTTVANT